MRHGIPEFRARQPLDRQLSGDVLNRILRELESLRITKVVNGTFKKLSGGTEIVVAPQRGGNEAQQILPWDLIAFPDPESTAVNPPYKIKVQPGLLSGFLPTNWDEEFTAQPTGTYYAKAKVSTDGKAITSVEIVIDTNEPETQEPQPFAIKSEVEILFGIFKEGITLRTIGPTNINVAPKTWFYEKVTDAQPGESPYKIYYVLA